FEDPGHTPLLIEHDDVITHVHLFLLRVVIIDQNIVRCSERTAFHEAEPATQLGEFPQIDAADGGETGNEGNRRSDSQFDARLLLEPIDEILRYSGGAEAHHGRVWRPHQNVGAHTATTPGGVLEHTLA